MHDLTFSLVYVFKKLKVEESLPFGLTGAAYCYNSGDYSYIFCDWLMILRCENKLDPIFDQWSNVYFSLYAQPEIQILNWL